MHDPARTPRPGQGWLAAGLGGLALLGLAGPAQGASRLEIRAASVELADIRAHDVTASVEPLRDGGLAVELRAGRLQGAGPPGAVSSVRFACSSLLVSDDRLACPDGRLAADPEGIGRQDTPVQFSWGTTGAWQLALPGLALAGGTGALHARDQPGGRWSAQLDLSGAAVAQVASLSAIASRLPTGLAPSGTLAGRLEATGQGAHLVAATLEATVSGLSFADEAGTLAGEQLGVELQARVAPAGGAAGWQVAGRLASATGQAYVDPVFLDLGARPARLAFEGVVAADGSEWALSQFRLAQDGIGEMEGAARLDFAGETLLRYVRARLHGVDLAGAWPVYGAPWAVGSQWSDLVAEGEVQGEVDLEEGVPARVLLQLTGVDLDSVTGSLAVAGLGGRFSWFSDRLRDSLAPGMDSAVFKSQLGWESARLWGIEFGAATLSFTTTGRHFRLLDPVVLPVFDGGLAIETLRLRHAGTPQMYLRFDAELAPVSLRLLSRSLGWPEFSGTLSGRIPRLELADGFVTLGGNLEAAVFDGTVTVRNLRLRDPLGEYPQLFADIDVERLDLEQVTSTFEFGMITGRLSGRVAGLETFDWMPVAFDASFYSTPGDRSTRRIDQRAVSNLSSIGGGSGGSVASALQGGFLRFFDSFRYDRLGLSCRLVNDVCRMDGVAPADGGYYIVKGSGLPRIDVIGNQRRVAWTRLVRQLAAITESPGPVVE